MEKVIKPDIKGEMDEFQRLSQDLRRDEKIDISVEELVRSFEGLKEQTLTDDVWPKLENTESNEIEKGDIEAVNDIAKMYNKTNPKKLVKAIKSGEYERPLILKMGDRYILIAGNTRLCTAAAMGVNPKVFIGEIGEDINESELLKGGNADNKSLIQIAKKHDAKNYYHIDDMVKSLKKQVEIGLPIEMEHTDDKDKAKEIVMDHLWENPSYYTKLKKSDVEKETKESMGAGSSGSFEGPVFSDVVLKKDIHKFHNSNLKEQQEEVGEATDASSSGGYDVPLFGKTPKGRRNPLKIDGPDSIYKGRAVTDKKFPKWGGPGGVFVKVKEKCKKFPYCNQGDTGALEFIKEDEEIVQAITETSKKYGIPYKEMEKIVLNEINKIFI
jgi:hypothetical protein